MQKTLPGHSWFMIKCSWGPEVDREAVKKFNEAYKYLFQLTDKNWRKKLETKDPKDPLLDLDSDSFRALNLIGKRQFIFIGQATSNRVQQLLALKIGLESHIKVDVLSATLVHDLHKAMN